MLLAYDFPLLSIFLTALWFYFLFAFFILLCLVIIDVFRNPDAGGFAKAAWLLTVVILPLVGTLIYAVVNGDGMAQRRLDRSRGPNLTRSYLQQAPGSGDSSPYIDLVAAGAGSDTEMQVGEAKA